MIFYSYSSIGVSVLILMIILEPQYVLFFPILKRFKHAPL